MVLRLVGWWAVLLAAYLLFISSLTRQEMVAGAIVAAVAAVIPALAIHGFGPWAPPSRMRWRHLVWLPVDVARDTAVLVRRLIGPRAHAGELEDERLPALGEHAAVRAYGVLVWSLTPGSYVIDVHLEEGPGSPGRVRVHRLSRAGAGDRMLGG